MKKPTIEMVEVIIHPLLLILFAWVTFIISATCFGGASDQGQALTGEALPLLGKVTAGFLSLMISLRGIAEIMMRLAPLLGARGEMLAKVAQVVWVVGKTVGQFGYGTPKPLVNQIKSAAVETHISKEKPMANIQNTIEVFDALDALAKALAESKRDGEINFWDAPKFASALVAGRKALADADQIKTELAELDEQEIQVIIQRGMASVTALASAILTKPEVK